MCPLPKIDGWLGPVPKNEARPVVDINDLRNIRLGGVVESRARDAAPRAGGQAQASASTSREQEGGARDKRKGWSRTKRGGKHGK